MMLLRCVNATIRSDRSPYSRYGTNWLWVGALWAALAVGCNTQPPAAPAQQAAPSVAGEPAAPATPAPVDESKKETRWIGTIPYDVFYDDPLAIAADATKIDVPTIAATPTTPGTTTPDPAVPMPATTTPAPTESLAPSEPAAPAASGELDWKVILPVSVLDEEVKSLRTRLTGNLQTVATFNKAVPVISNDGMLLAAMAAIATGHPEPLNWKEKAGFVRDLGGTIYSSAEGTGRTPFNACKEPFDKITTILDGGPPPEGTAEATVPFADVAYANELMKRIESSVSNLKSNINTEARMKEDPAGTQRELHVLAAIAAMLSTDSYDNSEEQKYQEFVKGFRDASLAGAQAVRSNDFEAFQKAINDIQNSCNPCHIQYRGKESGL